jgi:hypothetical protein
MRPNGVIRHRKFFSQFIDGAGFATQQGHNSPAGALEETLAQFGLFHVSPPEKQYNRASKKTQ